MEKLRPRLSSAILAVLLAMAILTGSTWLAACLRTSDFYNKSRLIRMIFSQDEIALSDVAGNKRNVDMILKFVGALTSAYIDFELIPVGEFDTFAAVFESVPSDVVIEKFEYHRKNLTITGQAETQEDYASFLAALQESEHFDSVSGHFYLTNDDTIRFTLECVSHYAAVRLAF